MLAEIALVEIAKFMLAENRIYILYLMNYFVRNHVKLGVFSKGIILCGGCWLRAWQISGGLQTCIAERSKVPNGQNTNCAMLGGQ